MLWELVYKNKMAFWPFMFLRPLYLYGFEFLKGEMGRKKWLLKKLEVKDIYSEDVDETLNFYMTWFIRVMAENSFPISP